METEEIQIIFNDNMNFNVTLIVLITFKDWLELM